MCDPLTIAGALLTVGSTAAGYAGQSRIDRAQADAMAAERMRQQRLDQEAQTLNTQSQDRYQDFEGQQEERAASLGDYFGSQTAAEPTAAAALPTSSSDITVREENKQRGQARDFTQAQGAALGNLRAFGDLLGGIGREQARDASLIGQIGGFKRGSSGILPFEMEAAQEKGAGFNLLGDILRGAGGISLNAGLSGRGLMGFGAASPTVSNAANVAAGTGTVPIPATRPQGNLRLGSLY